MVGIGMTLVTLATLLSADVRRMGLEPVLDEAADTKAPAAAQPALA